MFNTRLVREADALLIFEAIAYLIRNFGSPARPAVPSPLHKPQGLETLVRETTDQRTDEDWAQDTYATVLTEMNLPSDTARLDARTHYLPPHNGAISFNPEWLSTRGRFSARIVLSLSEMSLQGLSLDDTPASFEKGIIVLSGAAFFRQGFALTHLLPEVQDALNDAVGMPLPTRLCENTLVFATCLALTLNSQSPEMITATYGRLMTKSVRKKINTACKQIESFDTELKLLRVMAESGRNYGLAGRAGQTFSHQAQPQRTSWM